MEEECCEDTLEEEEECEDILEEEEEEEVGWGVVDSSCSLKKIVLL